MTDPKTPAVPTALVNLGVFYAKNPNEGARRARLIVELMAYIREAAEATGSPYGAVADETPAWVGAVYRLVLNRLLTAEVDDPPARGRVHVL